MAIVRTLATREEIPAELVGNDIAVIAKPCRQSPVASFGTATTLQVGDRVFAMARLALNVIGDDGSSATP